MKLSPAMERALKAIRADAKAKGSNVDLCHGAADTSIATLRALRDRGAIRFEGLRKAHYDTRGIFGRGYVRTHEYTSFYIVLVEAV